ncbi:MAG: response regulator transcription factor [Ardenticatenales bacterium]|nr:response regulator transcription factor [Ardenticatenales bacterium]
MADPAHSARVEDWNMGAVQDPSQEANDFYRILVVDDDQSILHLLREKLRIEGFQVFSAASGSDALSVIQKQGLPHLAIFDIHMPGMDGFELAEEVQGYSDLPIIFLTAVDDESAIVQGLELYAEDYITKPFSPRELIARVGRVLRRIGDFGYRLGALTRIDDHLTVDFAHQQISVGGEWVSMGPKEVKLLYILMRNAGRTVTSNFLLRRLWPMEEVFEDTLRVHVHRLRRKIEPQSGEHYYIQTERGVGYRFINPPSAR